MVEEERYFLENPFPPIQKKIPGREVGLSLGVCKKVSGHLLLSPENKHQDAGLLDSETFWIEAIPPLSREKDGPRSDSRRSGRENTWKSRIDPSP